jgi:hypothetical protein
MTPAPKPQSTFLRACSACAGDYEDPEETAWSEAIDQEGEEEGGEDASAGSAEQFESWERFPAREL